MRMRMPYAARSLPARLRSAPRVPPQVGLPMYLAYFLLYMTSVEFGVYWMHR
jgi:hypothetical protein